MNVIKANNDLILDRKKRAAFIESSIDSFVKQFANDSSFTEAHSLSYSTATILASIGRDIPQHLTGCQYVHYLNMLKSNTSLRVGRIR